MYLIHNTNLSSLKSILKDGYLKSYSLLKKEGYNVSKIESEGSGLYTENHFVYFSCVDKLFRDNISAQIILYFNSKLLFNRNFYVANLHSPYPDYLGEWKSGDEKKYKRKYNRHYKKYNTILKNLFKNSINTNKKYFQVFQQIAILNK
jgi:hypothetical protein